jgi:hypothetical protein
MTAFGKCTWPRTSFWPIARIPNRLGYLGSLNRSLASVTRRSTIAEDMFFSQLAPAQGAYTDSHNRHLHSSLESPVRGSGSMWRLRLLASGRRQNFVAQNPGSWLAMEVVLYCTIRGKFEEYSTCQPQIMYCVCMSSGSELSAAQGFRSNIACTQDRRLTTPV